MQFRELVLIEMGTIQGTSNKSGMQFHFIELLLELLLVENSAMLKFPVVSLDQKFNELE